MIKKKDKLVYLNPGQQAIVQQGQDNIKVNYDADVEEAVAWKNGRFSFKDANIQTIMKQLSRWYDVDVSYAGKIPDETFSGKISRDVNLRDLLDGLSFSDIRFKIEGRKLIILP
jgi:ferric-dicitrate binding protein FerR (iron transport regulator)